MIRVGFAVGSWQLVSLAAGLEAAAAADPPGTAHHDHLVLYETGPVSAALATAMAEVAAVVRPWRRILTAFDAFADLPRKPSRRQLDALVGGLRARLGLDRIDELWLCWLTRPAEKLVIEAWPDARIRLYEDGLTSYLPPARPMRGEGPIERLLAASPGWLRRSGDGGAASRRFARHRSTIDPRHLARVDSAWMLLADCWPPPPPLDRVPWHRVPIETVAACLAACASIPAVAAFHAPARERPAVLVLGQTLSRWGAMSREQELGLYADAITRVVERGYDVWWKEHPRASQPFFDDLAAGQAPGRVRALDLPFALPVELVAGRLGLAACVSGISAALYYLERLHGIAGYSVADQLTPWLSGPWAMQNRMVRQTMPPLRDLPAASPAPSDEP